MIARLDVQSARRISAGQVITDVSSVLKELLENALDADASVVTAHLVGYGLESIIVEDNGCGLPMKGFVDTATGRLCQGVRTPLLEARASTKATTASSSTDALASAPSCAPPASLGFRGEALHSLAQLADVTVTSTDAHTAPYAVTLTHTAGGNATLLSLSAGDGSSGTRVAVARLFCCLPVRQREAFNNRRRHLTRLIAMAKQYAVSHPGVRLIVTHQEDTLASRVTLVSLTGTGDLARSVAEAYGGLCVSRMSPVTWSCALGTISGLVSQVGGGGRLSAEHQVFVLDRRPVDLPRMARALQDAFAQCLPNAAQKLHVAFFLVIDSTEGAHKAEYDVNLTPNKRKVLLVREAALAEELYHLALRTFELSAESVSIDRQARATAIDNEKRIADQLTKMTRTNVSSTSFAQYVFKRRRTERSSASDDDDNGSIPTGADVSESRAVQSNQATSEVRGNSFDDEAAKEEDTDCSPLFASSTSSLGATVDAVTSESQRKETPASETAEAPDSVAVVVTDEGNVPRMRGPACCWRCVSAGPSAKCPWDSPPLVPRAVSPLARHDGRRKTAKKLGDQTDADLQSIFSKRSFHQMSIIGQFNQGFIVARLADDVFVIDQHASDEIYNYERLLAEYVARPQPLVAPVTLSLDAEEVTLALEHSEALRGHGFTVEGGDGATALRVLTVPVLPYDHVGAEDVAELLLQLVQYGAILRPLRAVWHSIATKACRSSIMIGTVLTPRMMRQVVDRLAGLERPWNCPHGRPTMRHLCHVSEICDRLPSLMKARNPETS